MEKSRVRGSPDTNRVANGRPTRVLLGISGSIAAYKAAELASELVRRGFEVRATMTPAATRFISPLTFEALTGQPVAIDVWDEQPGSSRMGHIELGQWADVFVVAPASADVLAHLALGLTTNMLEASALVTSAPMLLAPAMETAMWRHPATQNHVTTLRGRGATVLGPESGRLASGAEGEGRMSDPQRIADEIDRMAARRLSLAGARVLVTAGPTFEAIDPVRFLGNRSSGKMGYAVAQAARDRGAEVALVHGPVSLPDPPGMRVVPVESAQEMLEATLDCVSDRDVVVMAAAIADFRPKAPSSVKLRRQGDLRLELTATADVARELKTRAPDAIHVGFALETDAVRESARQKMRRKGQDLVVANLVSPAFSPFGADRNRVAFVTADEVVELPELPKREVAERLWDEVERLMSSRRADQTNRSS